MKGVIVATGLGHYLSPLTRYCPRLLVSVLKRPLVDYAIEAFARAGFEEVAVVLGPNGDVLRHYLEESERYGIAVYCLYNGQYPRGNATSIDAARAFVGGEPFVVAMADHLVSPRIVLTLLGRPRLSHVLCVSRQTRAGAVPYDATKVWMDQHGRVQRIGKRLKHWHAVDGGVFLFQPRVFDHLSDLVHRFDGHCSITSLARHMIRSSDDLYTCDVSGGFWVDVDTRDKPICMQQVLTVGLAGEELVA